MSKGISVIIYPVRDLDRAKKLYQELLGTEPYADWPYYVAFRNVDDIRTSLQALLDAGAQTQQEVKDVGGGKLTATVRDADGNVLGLIQEP
jgi:predicted enzyme related to lactoylglutathione lyase